MLTKLKELEETAEEAEYEEESDGEVTPDDIIVSSHNTAKRIRMELQDQRKAEKQALKAARETSSSASRSQQEPGYTKDEWTLHGTTHIIFQYKNPDEDLIPVVSLPLLKTCQSSLEFSQPF